MKLIITCCLWCMMYTACWGQQYSHEQVMAQADSMLGAKAGQLFHYFSYDAKSSYYSYERKKKERFRKIPKAKMHNHFVSAAIHYNFLLPYPECHCMDTITGGVTIMLDTGLILTNDIDLSFIPQFAVKGEECHFISKQKAIDIALQQTLHTSVAEPYAYLRPTAPGRDYVWVVLRTIWNEKNASGTAAAKDDMVIIDAVTGEVKENKVIPYAPHVY